MESTFEPKNVRRWLLLVLSLFVVAPDASGQADLIPSCPPIDDYLSATRFDYRQRNASDQMRWNYKDNWRIHTGPAKDRISKGEFSRGVMADLDFTLRWWPNHIPALLALVQYDLGGGKSHEFLSARCYLYGARQFAPTDASVFLVEGIYFFKKGMTAESRRAYERALELNPSSAEAHYNLGLLYFAQNDFAAARDQARLAYELGYPLSGLRDKLALVGEWDDTDADIGRDN